MEAFEAELLKDISSMPSHMNRSSDIYVKKVSLRRIIRNALTHVRLCGEPDCRMINCPEMKQVIAHPATCSLKTAGNCSICKRLMNLCWYHAIYCKETLCLALFCADIRVKIQEHENELLRKRLSQLALWPMGSSCGRKGQLFSPIATSAGGISIYARESPCYSPPPPYPGSPEPETPRRPYVPSAELLQVVEEIQAEAERQQTPHVEEQVVSSDDGSLHTDEEIDVDYLLSKLFNAIPYEDKVDSSLLRILRDFSD